MPEYPSKYHKTSFPAPNVLHIALNRPKLLNAMHKGAYLEYGELFRLASGDPEVRAIVLSGEGRAFCSGLDVAGMAPEFAEKRELSRDALALVKVIREFQDCISEPHFINKPVIGVAHGACIGLAIDILSAADLRFSDQNAYFSVREVELGMAADVGTLQRLPKIVGNLGWVKDVCFSGRNFKAHEALQQGFVQKIYPTKEETLEAAITYAADLAQKSPVAMHGTKRALNFAIENKHRDGLEQIAEFNSYGLGDDFIEGCMAMLESTRTKKKVKPTFSNL